MDFLRRFLRLKEVKILFGLLMVGIVLIVLPYIFSREQCPADYTQQQVDASDCIIGADIGSGMIWLIGVVTVVTVVSVMCIMWISAISSPVAKVAVVLLLTGSVFLTWGITSPSVLNKREVYKHARCSADDRTNGEAIIAEYCQFPRKSPLAEIDYFNNKVIIGAVSLTSGALVSGYYLLKRRSI